MADSNKGFMDINPQLAKDANSVYRPKSGSPAINGSSQAVLPGLSDMDGQKRSTPYDIGADEVMSGGTGRGPISICDVGPVTYSTGKSCSVAAALKAPTNITIM